MSERRASILFTTLSLFAFSVVGAIVPPPAAAMPHGVGAQAQAAPAASRRVGAIKGISGTSITLTPDSGPEVMVAVQSTTRLLRIAPGEKNLKNATPVQLQDLVIGDRILVGGQASDDGKTIAAATIIVMAHTDLEAHRQQELDDWKKRGSGGVVSAVDAANGTVTISINSLTGKKTVAVHASKDTVIRRYAPDSVKFEDAKASTLQEIHAGDQLRVRGSRSADGTEIAAEEIVTGVFPSFAATVISVDASTGVISVQDLQTKKAVQVKVTTDSQLHKLPPDVAQRIAMRLKAATGIAGVPGAGGGASGSGSGGSGAGSANTGSSVGSSGAGSAAAAGAGASPAGAPQAAATGQSAQGSAAGGRFTGSVPSLREGPGGAAGQPGTGAYPGGGTGGARGGDLQQMMTATPAVAPGDLKKGDAVVLLTTEGSPSNLSTVITLVAGVEPILQAAPSASQAMMLAPWSLGGGAPGGGEGP